jgi:hypothetical protein
MAFLIGGANSAADDAYDVANSCRFNDDDDARISRTLGTATNIDRWTMSCWVKRCTLGANSSIFTSEGAGIASTKGTIRFDSGDTLSGYLLYDGGWKSFTTNEKFRDVSAWYHIVVAVDTTDSTATNRMKVYVNGTQITSFATYNAMDQNADTYFNDDTEHQIGSLIDESEDGDMYLSEFVFIDGTQYAASDFGEFDSDTPTVFKPKDVSELTFGDNGAYLDFEDSDNLGDDESGNTNDWTETNLAAADQTTDTPTNNFCTLNPLAKIGGPTITEGNTIIKSHDTDRGIRATMAMSTGKWYFEAKVVYQEGSGVDDAYIGIQDSDGELKLGVNLISDTGQSSVIYEFRTGDLRKNGGDIGTNYAAAVNSIIGFKLDLDNGDLYIHDDGTYFNSGNAVVTSITSGVFYLPFFGVESEGGKSQWQTNFGGCPGFAISSGNADANGYGNFEYAVPSGYLALCTKNLGSDGG